MDSTTIIRSTSIQTHTGTELIITTLLAAWISPRAKFLVAVNLLTKQQQTWHVIGIYSVITTNQVHDEAHTLLYI